MNLQEVFSTVLNMSLTGSLVILFVLAARLLLRNAPKVFSYALWSVVLFRLLCPVSVSSALSLLNFTRATVSDTGAIVTTVDHPVVLDIYQYPAILPEPEDTEIHSGQQIQNNPSTPESNADLPKVPDAAPQQTTAESAIDPLAISAYIWLVGIGVLACYSLCVYCQLSKKIAGSVRLRKNIYLADHIPSAFVLGVFRPRIYLPSVLDASEQRYIIAHERCHIRRKDHIVKLLGYAALCIHWFNPLVWLAFVLSGKDMEMSCDEAVIGMYGPKIRAEYSASLLRQATGHRFIALTPLAFGEGDTKGRVMNMAKWKKPGFRAILCAVILCMCVLAACATNPSETTEQAETNETTAPATQPAENLLQITEAEADKLCADALEQLKNLESYYILYEYHTEPKGTIEYRRHGNNLLSIYSESIPGIGDWIIFDGKYGSFYGDFWVVDEENTTRNANDWLKKWSMEGKTVSSMEINGNTVTYEAAWPYELAPNGEYRGSFTYTFRNDGTLDSVVRRYALYLEGGETELVEDSITVQAEDPQATYAAIKAIADQCITHGQLEENRYQNKLVSEIPSNKTAYDQDYMLGAGQMRWYFHNEEFSCAIGTDNPTPTGVTVFHTEADNSGGSFTADENFWLEKFVDGKWQFVDEQIQEVSDPERKLTVDFYGLESYTLDWSDSYGKLEAGFYRVGRYYTARMPGAGDDTQVCYAKFRLYDENQEELIRKCRDAFTTLLNSKAYHIRYYQLIESINVCEFNDQYWKYGSSHLERIENTMADGSVSIGGIMYRDGKGYSMDWEDDDETKRITNWKQVDHIDESDFDSWSWTFTIYDGSVVGVEENGNQIIVYTSYDLADAETRFTFRTDGSLDSVELYKHPSDGTAYLGASVKVLDTPAEEIKALIESQDVSKPPAFSWSEDKDKYPNARTDGFKNTAKSAVQSMEDALWLADKECTMPPQDPLGGERYNIVEIAYDSDAGIWRVYLRYSQNIDGDQIIYINDDGITQMIVTTEE